MMKSLLVVLGPTAVGKTRFAANIANKYNGCIISADSRQVYKGMDLGTGKDYEDYLIDENKIQYYLIDIVEPGFEYNLFQFKKDFNAAYCEILNENKLPILCGGTGLYIQSVLNNNKILEVPINNILREQLILKSMDELIVELSLLKKLHNKTDITDKNRLIRAIEIEYFKLKHAPELDIPDLNPFIIGIHLDREIIRNRIKLRLIDRLKKGMIDEVKNLLNKGIPKEQLLFYGLEYRYITQYLFNEIDYQTMEEKLFIAIADFAKRQSTWFRRMEKQGVKINWVDGLLDDTAKLQAFTKIFYQFRALN